MSGRAGLRSLFRKWRHKEGIWGCFAFYYLSEEPGCRGTGIHRSPSILRLGFSCNPVLLRLCPWRWKPGSTFCVGWFGLVCWPGHQKARGRALGAQSVQRWWSSGLCSCSIEHSYMPRTYEHYPCRKVSCNSSTPDLSELIVEEDSNEEGEWSYLM